MPVDETVSILLVDDRPENLLALEAILKPLGHQLLKALSGEEALKHVLQHDIAVILLDVHMPGMDGFETAELIHSRKRSRYTPIIFLTAVNISDTYMFRGYEAGAVDYVLKPFVPQILISKVSVLVELFLQNRKIRQQTEQLNATIAELENEVAQRKSTELALRQAQEELERRVRERTAGLAAVNQALRAEMTVRQQVEEERARLLVREQQARADAEAAVYVRDQFLSIASHELKTPLTALLGNTQLLQRRVAKNNLLDTKNQHVLDVIERQANRLKKLIDALLDISRIQHGQLELTHKSLDLTALTKRMIAEVQPFLHNHTITARGLDEPLMIVGDELRLEEVVQNVLQNAIKYSPEGGEIEVRLDADLPFIELSICDPGIGIPPEALDQLFQRYYRADNAEVNRIHGMGVGLYLVKEIVKLHGGTVHVSSQEGIGSTFTIRLPCTVHADAVGS